jgi:uncharacterized protein YbjT (DUF2867 family)
MKVVVVGGTGLIGTKVVGILRRAGHEVVSASPASGIDTITGEGLAVALAGADVVVDVANSPSLSDRDVLKFFETSGHNLLTGEAVAGVSHHVVLSIVNADRLPDSGYLSAKVVQEKLVKGSGTAYTIVRSTQFFEMLPALANANTEGNTVRLSPALFQPVASDDVAALLAAVALAAPVNGTIEVAGPDRAPMSDLVRRFLVAKGDERPVVSDRHARYFGTELSDSSLVPGNGAHIGATRFDDWLRAAV